MVGRGGHERHTGWKSQVFLRIKMKDNIGQQQPISKNKKYQKQLEPDAELMWKKNEDGSLTVLYLPKHWVEKGFKIPVSGVGLNEDDALDDLRFTYKIWEDQRTP